MSKGLNCMNCCIGDFKHSLCNCDEGLCKELKSIGNSEDFEKKVMNRIQPKKEKKQKWIKKMIVIKNVKHEAYTPKWYCPSCGEEYDPAVVKAFGIKFCYKCGERVEE